MDETPTNTVQCTDPIEYCLTSAQVAEILEVSTRTLHRMVDRGEFPAPFKVGRQSRWLPQTVRDHLVNAQTEAEKRR